MKDKRMGMNNKVRIVGEVVSELIFSHEVYGEYFYTTNIKVNRLSGTEDIVPCIVSEYMLDKELEYCGKKVEVLGSYRSWNKHIGQRSKLILFVFTSNLEVCELAEDGSANNKVELDGYLCKKPVYRETPLGREIADCVIAVNRGKGKSDYIPCITWGSDARFMATLNIGDYVRCAGRIQSREYAKVENDLVTSRTAYEVSISQLERVVNDID